MKIINFSLAFISILAVIPTIFAFPIIVVTAIIGANKKDYSLLKKYLKIWGISFLVLIGVMVIFAITNTITK